METMVPKLVAEDIPLLNSLLSDVFPGVAYVPAEMSRLRDEIAKVCREMFLTYSEVVNGDEVGGPWVEKVCWHVSLPHTHTHTHPLNSEWQWPVCTSLQTDNHVSTPPLSCFYRPDGLVQPTAECLI